MKRIWVNGSVLIFMFFLWGCGSTNSGDSLPPVPVFKMAAWFDRQVSALVANYDDPGFSRQLAEGIRYRVIFVTLKSSGGAAGIHLFPAGAFTFSGIDGVDYPVDLLTYSVDDVYLYPDFFDCVSIAGTVPPNESRTCAEVFILPELLAGGTLIYDSPACCGLPDPVQYHAEVDIVF